MAGTTQSGIWAQHVVAWLDFDEASFQRTLQRGGIGGDPLALPLAVGVRNRYGGEQRLRIQVQRPSEHGCAVAHLHDPAAAHDGHAVAQVADHAQVVGDEQVRQLEVALQVLQQVDDLRLDETSSAVMGSSATTKRGLSAIARAITTRWRWPPENSCG